MDLIYGMQAFFNEKKLISEFSLWEIIDNFTVTVRLETALFEFNVVFETYILRSNPF